MANNKFKVFTLADDDSVISTISFNGNELIGGSVTPIAKSKTQRNQAGATTLILQQKTGTVFHEIRQTFHILGSSTTVKLRSIRNHILAGGTLRVAPRPLEDPTELYNCIVDPRILANSLFSGESRMGQTAELVFMESNQDSLVSVSGDVIIVS